MDSEPSGSGASPEAGEAIGLVGQADLDTQHQRIFVALQRMDESLRGPYPLATLGPRLKQLEELAMEHFRDEEDFLANTGYPHLHAHRLDHEMLMERGHNLIADYSSPDSPPLSGLCEGFLELFRHHIDVVDGDYASFLERRQLEALADPAMDGGLPGAE